MVNGDGSPPVVLAIVKPNPIVVERPACRAMKDVCKATVSAACAEAHTQAGTSRQPETTSASARACLAGGCGEAPCIRTLDKVSPAR